jgi:hypothetical protein
MDKSVHQARWLLAPVLGICAGFIAFGMFVS